MSQATSFPALPLHPKIENIILAIDMNLKADSNHLKLDDHFFSIRLLKLVDFGSSFGRSTFILNRSRIHKNQR